MFFPMNFLQKLFLTPVHNRYGCSSPEPLHRLWAQLHMNTTQYKSVQLSSCKVRIFYFYFYSPNGSPLTLPFSKLHLFIHLFPIRLKYMALWSIVVVKLCWSIEGCNKGSHWLSLELSWCVHLWKCSRWQRWIMSEERRPQVWLLSAIFKV